MKRILAFVLALSILLSLTACGSGTSAATMHLRKTEGTVAVSDGENKDIAPKDNLGLYSGYQVGTRAESYAWIDLDKVKLTKMDANSEIEVIKEDKLLEINVKSGSLFFNITEPLADDESLNIRTSSMAVGIRGTCGWVTENAAALLEGTVEVTAGDETVTISAGEQAWLTQEGALEVREFTFNSIPAFVARELLDDNALQKAVSEASGLYIPTTYEELLSALEKDREIVYTEEIDFERDNSPEFLVVELEDLGGNQEDFADEGHFPYRRLRVAIYRNSSEGVRALTGKALVIWRGMVSQSCSLVERDGRLFLKCSGVSETLGTFEEYFGSLAERDGGAGDWGETDYFHDRFGYFYVANHDEKGFVLNDTEQVTSIQNPYTFVRELCKVDGLDVE